MQKYGEKEGRDGEQVDQVHGLEQELELPGRAKEPDEILEGEVDHADGVDGIEQVNHLPEAVHAVLLVPVLRFWAQAAAEGEKERGRKKHARGNLLGYIPYLCLIFSGLFVHGVGSRGCVVVYGIYILSVCLFVL